MPNGILPVSTKEVSTMQNLLVFVHSLRRTSCRLTRIQAGVEKHFRYQRGFIFKYEWWRRQNRFSIFFYQILPIMILKNRGLREFQRNRDNFFLFLWMFGENGLIAENWKQETLLENFKTVPVVLDVAQKEEFSFCLCRFVNEAGRKDCKYIYFIYMSRTTGIVMSVCVCVCLSMHFCKHVP